LSRLAERPTVGLGVPHELVTVSALVGGIEAVLEGDFGDDLRSSVVGVQFLEPAMDIPPADAAEAEDSVQSLDDEDDKEQRALQSVQF